MPKAKITAFSFMIFSVFFTTFVGNGVATETYKLRTTKYADRWEQLGVGYEEGHVIVVEEAKGIISNMEGKAFGDGWVLEHVGLLDVNSKTGVAFGHGYEEVTDKDGDKYFSRWEGEAISENRWQGRYTVIGGTGKYRGIAGGGIWSLTSVAPMQWYTDERWELELPSRLPYGAAKYGPGVSDTEIKIGNTVPYSGPAAAYGTIGRAAEAYFAKINDEGGINGRKIRFISYDDAYSASKTVEQVRRLVEQDEVLLLFHTLGTAPNTAIWEYVNREMIPHIFISTGATKWGDPMGHPWTMGFQPNYQSEGQIYAQYVLRNVPNAKIGILYQDDAFGRDYLKGFKDGLGYNAKTMIVSEQTYQVSDQTVEPQIDNLKQSGANVFFNVCIPKFAVQAIRRAADIGWKPIHLISNVSNSVGSVLKPAGLGASTGLISCFYMKDPDDPQWQHDPAVKEFRSWLKRYYPEGSAHDTLNVDGYTAAQALVQVLERCGEDLTRENVMKQAANITSLELPMLLPGIKIDTSPSDFYPLQQLQLARFDGERWVLFGEVLEAAVK